MRSRRKPRRRRAKYHARNQRQQEGKSQHQQRWRHANRQKVRAVKRQGKQQPRRPHRHDQSHHAPANRQQHAFRQRLPDDLPPRCPERQPHRRLPASCHAPRQQQIRHVGARDQEHQPADRQQNLQTPPVLFLHHRHARSRRHHVQRLSRQHANHIRHPVRGIPRIVLHPLPQHSRESRRHPRRRRSPLQPPHHP